MKTQIGSISRLSNQQLIAQVQELARHEREATASLVAHLAELDARKLYLGQGYASLFAYCVDVLQLSECEAYMRMKAARLSRRFPVVLDKLESGAVNLTTLKLLIPILTAENHERLLVAAEHKSKRQVEELVPSVAPQPAIEASIRKLPARSAAPGQAEGLADALLDAAPRVRFVGPALRIAAPEAPKPAAVQPAIAAVVPAAVPAAIKPAVIAPLAPDLYKIEFTASAETRAKLRRAHNLLRHQIPTGDPAAIIDRALTMLVAHLEKTRLAWTDRPRPARPTRKGSRHIPAAVRRAVWQRDGGRCAFTSPDGRRCNEPGFFQFHHVKPHGDGGEPSIENIELRCRAHNEYEGEMYFGQGYEAAKNAAIQKRMARRQAQRAAGSDRASNHDIVRESTAVYGRLLVIEKHDSNWFRNQLLRDVTGGLQWGALGRALPPRLRARRGATQSSVTRR